MCASCIDIVRAWNHIPHVKVIRMTKVRQLLMENRVLEWLATTVTNLTLRAAKAVVPILVEGPCLRMRLERRVRMKCVLRNIRHSDEMIGLKGWTAAQISKTRRKSLHLRRRDTGIGKRRRTSTIGCWCLHMHIPGTVGQAISLCCVQKFSVSLIR